MGEAKKRGVAAVQAALDRELSAAICKPERLEDRGRVGYAVSVGALGTLALRAHCGAARRCGECGGVGHGYGGLRGHGAPGLDGNGGSSGDELAARTPGRERVATALGAVDSGYRCDGETAVWEAG